MQMNDKRLGQQARHRVEAEFSARAMAEKYLPVYRGVPKSNDNFRDVQHYFQTWPPHARI